MNDELTLLCLSHLRWDHVWQRPQQLMSRFAGHCRVIYVDPPERTQTVQQAQLAEQPGVDGMRLVRPLFPESLVGTSDDRYQKMWLSLLPDVLATAGTNTILWVSSSLSHHLVAAAKPHVKL